MIDLSELIELYPWHIQCLYLKTHWETIAVCSTKEEAEREFPRFKIKERDISRYRIINVKEDASS